MKKVFAKLLCYWSWLKKPSYWKCDDNQAVEHVQHAIIDLLTTLKSHWPRTSGQGWATAKFHEQLHVPDDIDRYGAPQNYHTGPAEHNHIDLVKKMARQSTKNRSLLDHQIGTRWSETFVINTVYDRMSMFHPTPILSSTNNNTNNDMSRKGYVTIKRQDDNYEILAQGWCKSNDYTETFFCEDSIRVIAFLCPINKTTMVQVFTEYRRNGEIFRAHPNY